MIYIYIVVFAIKMFLYTFKISVNLEQVKGWQTFPVKGQL